MRRDSRDLELAFATKELRELCIHASHAKERLGLKAASNLRDRLADLSAAQNASDIFVLPGQPTVVTINDGRIGIAAKLAEGVHLVYVPNHASRKLLANGDTDWSRVRRIKILRID